jgi:hypothetical protein
MGADGRGWARMGADGADGADGGIGLRAIRVKLEILLVVLELELVLVHRVHPRTNDENDWFGWVGLRDVRVRAGPPGSGARSMLP